MSYVDPEIISYIPTRSVRQLGNVGREGAVDSELYKVDMRGKNDWAKKHKEHIQAWDCRMESIPTRKQFLLTDMVTADDYLTWFKAIDKLYLLPPEARSRQIWSKRQCRSP
ncbi:hypothetical protein Gotur_027108 [Gossypium turneri]